MLPRSMSSLSSLLLAMSCLALYALAGARALRGRAGALLVVTPVTLHAALLATTVFQGGSLTLGVSEALSLFAWQSAALLWVFCLSQPLQPLGSVVYPVAGLAALANALLPTPANPVPIADWRVQLHVVLSLFSAGLLTLAAAQALVLAAQERLLHRHQPLRFAQAMPPLLTMERLLFQLIGLGFFLLSLALLSGLLFVHDLLAQHLAHKTVLSVVAWFLLGVLLWGRWRHGWRGRAAIRWTLGAYLTLLLAYFGSKWVLEELLNKTWT